MNADELRTAFTDFWVGKGHQPRASASLIPHEDALLFTIAGMVPFMPYFLGEEAPPAKRITAIQKCVRAGGKHNDLDDIGRTNRHFTFFEMMGNFSFGDYFKAEAITWAWEFFTEVLELDGDRLWVTVHTSDDEAEQMWKTLVGMPADRIQRLDADNWWAAGDTGPCGPCSEIFYDLGPEHGPDGGPAYSESRFVEIWNLVFMQFRRQENGELVPLPATGIDTGAGLERILTVLQGADTIWDIDLFKTLLAAASAITGVVAGEDDERDVSLRIFADHARAVTFLISDGVFPSNEDRGYVLRRIIRRAVRHAHVLGVEDLVMASLVDAVVGVMGDAYPDIVKNQVFIRDVVNNEEERFRETLATGSAILDDALGDLEPRGELAGSVAFQLHDTYGFPVELTEEILSERGFTVDRDGFDAAMQVQRTMARGARRTTARASTEAYRQLLDEFGPTEFVRDRPTTDATVLAVLNPNTEVASNNSAATDATAEGNGAATDGSAFDSNDAAVQAGTIEIVVDRTTFYAEGGGQVGDTGTISSSSGSVRVIDTTAAIAGLTLHTCERISGSIGVGDSVTTAVDWDRRAAIRRNHTGTHILHWALREVLGGHVKQAGSHVDADRLRFDFSHFEAVSDDQLGRIEDLVNDQLLSNGPVRHYETSMEHAQKSGAIAFFGDKYGDIVRVLEAGEHSVELCGGTHVRALGDIGQLHIVTEASIGSNLRRIEAITGEATVARLRAAETEISEAAGLLGSSPDELTDAVRKRISEVKELRSQLKSLQLQAAAGKAAELAALAVDGVVVTRVDGVDRDAIRDMALAARDAEGVEAVVIAGAPDGGGVVLVAAVVPDGRFSAASLIEQSAQTVQGGFGRKGDPPFVMAGGRNVDGIDDALDQARAAADAVT